MRGRRGEFAIHGFDGVGDAGAIAVPGLQHVEIEHRRIVDACPRGAGRMNGDGMMVRIGRAHVARQFRQPVLLRLPHPAPCVLDR